MKRNQFILENLTSIEPRMLTIISIWGDTGLYDGDRDLSDIAAYNAAVNSLAQEQRLTLEE